MTTQVKTNASQHDISPVDFLIITALAKERDAVLAQLDTPRKIQRHGSPTYYRATIPAYAEEGVYEVAVTMLSQMGNVEATQHTLRAIQDLSPDYVLMVGIAGGVEGSVRLGDVVINTQVIYYEQVKQRPDGPDHRPQIYPADPRLLERAQNYSDITWRELIPITRPRQRRKTVEADASAVIFGPIAVGEKIVADAAVVASFRNFHSKIVAVEMESFGVAVAAANSVDRPRFLAIRGISDYANAKKNDQWQDYAAAAAAAFAIGFLRSGPVTPRSVRAAELIAPTHTLIAVRHQSMEPIIEKAIASALMPEFEGYDITELLIDQTDLYTAGRLHDPLSAVQRQSDLRLQLDTLRNKHPGAHVAYYGIAHIPLLFLAGYTLSDQRAVLLFDYNRQAALWNQLQGGGDELPLRCEGLPARGKRTTGDVVLRISISYSVTPESIAEMISTPLASIHLTLDQPTINAVRSVRQVKAYGQAFRALLDDIKRRLPNTRAIHLFYAGPAALAFHLGQQISPTIHPHVVVYNYSSKDDPHYSWGLTITKGTEAADFILKPGKLKEAK